MEAARAAEETINKTRRSVMNAWKLFVLSGSISLFLTYAGVLLQAELPSGGERPVAPSTGTVLVDDCRLTGVVAEKSGKYFAEFGIENPGSSDAKVEFYYSVVHTPGMSPMMRMMPQPRALTNGHCQVTIKAGGRASERCEFNVPWLPASLLQAEKKESLTGGDADGTTPARWSLFVSRAEISSPKGWGGVVPVVGSATGRLDKGVMTIASTVETGGSRFRAIPGKTKTEVQ